MGTATTGSHDGPRARNEPNEGLDRPLQQSSVEPGWVQAASRHANSEQGSERGEAQKTGCKRRGPEHPFPRPPSLSLRPPSVSASSPFSHFTADGSRSQHTRPRPAAQAPSGKTSWVPCCRIRYAARGRFSPRLRGTDRSHLAEYWCRTVVRRQRRRPWTGLVMRESPCPALAQSELLTGVTVFRIAYLQRPCVRWVHVDGVRVGCACVHGGGG